MKQNQDEIFLYQNFQELPQSKNNRSCTNVFCLVFGLAFSIIILAIATVLFKKSTFYSYMYPTDSSGNICGLDLPNYPYLLFPSAPLIQSRVCVNACPIRGQTHVVCHPNSVVKTCSLSPITDTYAQNTFFGNFCWPTDSKLTQNLQKTAKLQPRMQFVASMRGISYSLLLALALSIIFLLLVQFVAQFMNYIVLPLSLVALIFSTVLVGTFSTSQGALKTGLFVSLIVVAVVMALSFFRALYSIKLHLILLKAAANVASWRKSTFFFIPLFLIFLILFIGMVGFEFLGYWSNGRKIFLPAEYLYYQIHGFSFSTGVLILLIIQLLWGMSFVKQSFNFCLSGNAISWYFEQALGESKGNCSFLFIIYWKHLGSIIACSFITSFFSIFDYIFDMIRPVSQEDCHSSCFGSVCSWFHTLGDVVRTDALAIVGATGHQYWQSSTFGQNLSKKVPLTDFYQFSSRLFNLCSHFLIASLSLIFGIYVGKVTSIEAVAVILVGSILVSTCFISFHLNLAQTIEMMYLLDQKQLLSEKLQFNKRASNIGVSNYRPNLAIELHALEFQQDAE